MVIHLLSQSIFIFTAVDAIGSFRVDDESRGRKPLPDSLLSTTEQSRSV